MVQRIPHGDSAVEIRQAFQRLTAQSDVLTTGAANEILVGQGVGVTPLWGTIDISASTNLTVTSPITLTDDDIGLDESAVDHGSIGGLGDDDHTIYVLADGTRALGGDWSLGSNDLTSVGLFGGVDVPEMNQFFNGTFQEMFDATVTSDGAIITMSLEKSGGGDLTMQLSDGYTTLDCTDPLQTIALTAGADDASPQANYIYIPQSSKVVTKSTSSWPATEHIKIAYFLVPTAGFVQTNGCYVNQNWNDFLAGATPQGHMSHISKKVRHLGASWFSGVSAAGATASYFTIGVNTTDWLSTAGVILQLHEHTFPAFNTSTGDVVLVVNQNGTAYDDIADLYSIVNDNTGTPIGNNKYFNLVFWGVMNKSGEFAALMVNLPGGFYTRAADAAIDADGYDVYDIPREFSIDSGTGFLIARVTFQMGGTWTHVSTTDLRGLTPSTASGSSVNDHGGLGGLTDVADHPGYLLVDGTRNLTGNLALSAGVTIDGRELSTDGTKLDGIESAADVTDATNVAAAGAAMSGGAFHDGFSDFASNEHVVLPGTIANVLSDHTRANHVGLELPATTATNAYFSGNLSLASDTTTLVTLNLERFDLGSDFDTTNYKYVVPETGYYLCTISLKFVNIGSGKWARIWLDDQNPTTLMYAWLIPSGVGDTLLEYTQLLYLTAADELKMYARQNEATARNTTCDWGRGFSIMRVA